MTYSSCLEFLITNQNSDGGWGYHPASPSAVEATAWALTALISHAERRPWPRCVTRAREWLLRRNGPTAPGPPFPASPKAVG